MFQKKLLSSASLGLCAAVFLFAVSIFAQKTPAPGEVVGFTPGDDRKLASWRQVVDYFRKLDAASDRVKFEEIGKSTLGRPFVYATISAPENLKNLGKYKARNAKLADPRLIGSSERLAQSLIRQGKTIVLITCGIHSTEVGSTLSSMLIAERLASSNEPEIRKILQNTIVLLVPSLNPDGVDIVKNWYDKTLGTPFEGTSPPELYHKYVGHDNNRDWYAFTQVETQLTVEKIHNQWHPQIVHDIHQQGERGSRLFLPPYMQPVEPNVPKEIVEGFTELGNFMANDLRQKGFQGITTNSTYDAWTPARAYSHYHAGVRILSETASAKLATPITIKYEDLRSGLGYDVRKESANFSPVWLGGEWKLRDITNYMTTASFSLLRHAADNREAWLSRFYAVGKEAVRPRKNGELQGFRIEMEDANAMRLIDVLTVAGVESEPIEPQKKPDKDGLAALPDRFVKMAQPYGSFAKALLENQAYPDLKNEKGEPIPPYDVTAHTLPLLYGVRVTPVFKPVTRVYMDSPIMFSSYLSREGFGKESIGIYKSSVPSMDEGWTRWIADKHISNYSGKTWLSLEDSRLRASVFPRTLRTIIFPDQPANQILNGYAKGAMPEEYTGGVGKDGVKNLRKFVEDGGTLVFLNRASDFAVKEFGLPVRDVTAGLPRKDFYIPGSILRTEIDTNHRIAEGMPRESIAWFENSPAFEITGDGANVEIIARYPQNPKDVLLSGWALGAEKIAGKAALVSINIGKGKIILFGFRPQYRGQSLATFPLFFNAISE
ncbi:MAG TPA: M14 family metallopeptidase [Pyrinomonadaceae bacterium]|nr:M14 family metallopeptidase [Pyrinomonadaceae bacterium]